MVAKIISGAVHGVDGKLIDVEIDMSGGLPAFNIVGLPDSSVKEASERVRSALKNSYFQLPPKRITVNLAPADIRKEGSAYDLPIALGLLCCMEIIPPESLKNIFAAGELSLDGELRPITGVLSMVHSAVLNGIHICVVPKQNAEEAALIENATVIPASNLGEIIEHFTGIPIKSYNRIADENLLENFESLLDFADVKGQESVKRAIKIAAAGGHNILMLGPPGSGKTMMARRIPGILPALTFPESIEVSKIYSVAGLIQDRGNLVKNRPFRSPHHTASYAALVGGGKIPKPGEVSLSHRGVLFLDELPEFSRNVLEALRQPLEDREVSISRAATSINYPSDFMLVASMNPCPCGFFGEQERCACTERQINSYLDKISGPLLDRIDIHAEAARVSYKDFASETNQKATESTKEMREQVQKAREIQLKRYAGKNITTNAQLDGATIDEFCTLNPESQALIERMYDVLGLSARGYHKILKLSRTIADLANSTEIKIEHITEAIQYRTLDRKYWR